MKKGLLLTAIGGFLAAAGISKMLKKEEIIEDADVEFIEDEDETEASEEISEE